MNIRHLVIVLMIVTLAYASAQSSAKPVSQPVSVNPNLPKVGSVAPDLTFLHLLQAPVGTKVDWPSLRGRVVVLEFWATWCAPCIAEIPVLNALQASLDPAKVQLISVDDEDPAVVQNFVRKKPINGWIGIDTSGKILERYGVYGRPATVVIGPDGRVVSTTVRPEQLTSARLLKLANGQHINPGGDVDAQVKARLDAATKQAFTAQTGPAGESNGGLVQINVTPGDPVQGDVEPDTHVMMRGPGQFDITNGSPAMLLSSVTDIPESRIITAKDVPKAFYNLHVSAPNTDPHQLAKAVEQTISLSTHLRIEHHSQVEDAYGLTATPAAASHMVQSQQDGVAFYSQKRQSLQCLNATLDQVAGALESAVGAPVVNQTGLSGKLMSVLNVAPNDISSANNALSPLGLELTRARRPIETITLSAMPASPAAP